VLPFLTSKFGLDIPADLTLKVKKIYDIEAIPDGKDVKHDGISSKGTLKAKVDVEVEGRLNYPGGI